MFLAQAANVVWGKRNLDAEAWAVLDSLPPETTLQGVRNGRWSGPGVSQEGSVVRNASNDVVGI